MIKFAFILNESQRIELSNDEIMLKSPSGLGVTLSPNMVNLKNGFFKSVNDEDPQMPIVCDLYFFGDTVNSDPYMQYQVLVNSLLHASKIELSYTPYGTDEYRREILIDSINKTQKIKNGTLICPSSFLPKTPWYKTQNVELEMRASSDDVNLYTATVNISAGNIPAAFEITAQNSGTPWQVNFVSMPSYDVLGALAFPLSGEGLINTAGFFEYSSRYGNSYAMHTSSGGTMTDLVDRVCIENELFPRFPVGKTIQVMIVYAQGTAKPSKIDMKLYTYYRSV